MSDPSFRIRRATAGDAALLARYRVGMFADMKQLDPASDVARRIEAATRRLLVRALPSGAWTAWVAEDRDGPVGGGAAIVRPAFPSILCPDGGEYAYLLNFFVEPRARRRGVATALMRACIAWCEERGFVRAELHASDEGRRVYQRLGFEPRGGEMVWKPSARG